MFVLLFYSFINNKSADPLLIVRFHSDWMIIYAREREQDFIYAGDDVHPSIESLRNNIDIGLLDMRAEQSEDCWWIETIPLNWSDFSFREIYSSIELLKRSNLEQARTTFNRICPSTSTGFLLLSSSSSFFFSLQIFFHQYLRITHSSSHHHHHRLLRFMWVTLTWIERLLGAIGSMCSLQLIGMSSGGCAL